MICAHTAGVHVFCCYYCCSSSQTSNAQRNANKDVSGTLMRLERSLAVRKMDICGGGRRRVVPLCLGDGVNDVSHAAAVKTDLLGVYTCPAQPRIEICWIQVCGCMELI